MNPVENNLFGNWYVTDVMNVDSQRRDPVYEECNSSSCRQSGAVDGFPVQNSSFENYNFYNEVGNSRNSLHSFQMVDTSDSIITVNNDNTFNTSNTCYTKNTLNTVSTLNVPNLPYDCNCIDNNVKQNRKRMQQYYVDKKEIIKKIRQIHHRCNCEIISKKKSEYYLENREQMNEKKSKYYKKHREEISAKNSEYYKENREGILRKHIDDYDEDSYLKDIEKGPTIQCISCERLFFDYSMSLLTYKQLLKQCTLDFLKNTCRYGNFDPDSGNFDPDSRNLGYACLNCKKYLMEGKIPPLSLAHKELQFPEIPPELADLKGIEERLLAPRIGFIQIRESFVDSQKKSKGRIVNVPTDVESTLQLLPRRYEDLGIIMVKLKR